MKKDLPLRNFQLNSIQINSSVLKTMWAQNKDIIVPLIVIAVCILLFYYFILQQIQTIREIRQKEEETRARIEVLHENEKFVTQLPQDALVSQLQLVTAVLPPGKDFAAILNAIATSASNAHVSLSDFGLAVGDLAPTAGKLADKQLFLSVDLTLTGKIDGSKQFISLLHQAFPLAEVASFLQSDDTANMRVQFFYRPAPYIQFNNKVQLQKLEESELNLLSQLDSWRTGAAVPNLIQPTLSPTSTPSATIVP